MDKSTVILKRTEFFNEMMYRLNEPPSSIDVVLQQDKYYIKPNKDETFINPEYGDIAIAIKGKFYEQKFKLYYTIWQFGEILKIGVAIYDEDLQGAFTSDNHNEVFYIWGQDTPRIDVAHGCVFYDWEFQVPHLYESYRHQERFILGLRHMHFRVMRIIHDECQRISLEKKETLQDVDLKNFENQLKNS